jgi:hypothetical protein
MQALQLLPLACLLIIPAVKADEWALHKSAMNHHRRLLTAGEYIHKRGNSHRNSRCAPSA